jgi:hypothetical protein
MSAQRIIDVRRSRVMRTESAKVRPGTPGEQGVPGQWAELADGRVDQGLTKGVSYTRSSLRSSRTCGRCRYERSASRSAGTEARRVSS